MMLGSLVTGFLGDRYGRRFTYQANLAIFGLASIAAAFSPSMQVLILIQFVIGFGLARKMWSDIPRLRNLFRRNPAENGWDS